MKLNPDCIRDLMLYLEEKTKIDPPGTFDYTVPHFRLFDPELLADLPNFKKYEYAELLYHVLQLSESGYLVTDFAFNSARGELGFRLTTIYYVTPRGHEFAAKLRDEEKWSKKIKPIASAFGSISLSIIESIASGVASAALEKLIQE